MPKAGTRKRLHTRRNPKHVRAVCLRMTDSNVDQLDLLCEKNLRSRREVVEILVAEAYAELMADPSARIDPV